MEDFSTYTVPPSVNLTVEALTVEGAMMKPIDSMSAHMENTPAGATVGLLMPAVLLELALGGLGLHLLVLGQAD